MQNTANRAEAALMGGHTTSTDGKLLYCKEPQILTV